MITPTFKDLVTGEIAKGDENGIYWWTEGNGSCDCNRAQFFDKDDEMDASMRLAHPDLKEWESFCYGCKRFVAIDVEGDFEGSSKLEILSGLNSGYPVLLGTKP